LSGGTFVQGGFCPRPEISLKLNNVEFVQYCGGHFENGDR